MPYEGGLVPRRRTLSSKIGGLWSLKVESYSAYYGNGILTDETGIMPTIDGMQETASEGHAWPPKSNSGLSDIGGEFYTSKSYVVTGKSRISLENRRYFYDGTAGFFAWYNGPIYPMDPTLCQWPTPIDSSQGELDAAGATAIARCKPTNSVADLSVFLGELYREGLPSLVGSSNWKARALSAKNAAKDYLNFQFGWLPVVRDIRKFAEAVASADTVLEQYERDAGKVVRRSYNFPSETTTTSEVLLHNVRAFLPAYSSELQDGASEGRVILTRETVRDRWFKGAFTYHMPTGYDSRSAVARNALKAKKLLGLSLTPETLWNLAPWSWAVDWFSNTGDVISNLSDWATDGLVLQYGYVMEHTVTKNIYTYVGPTGLLNRSINVPPLVFVNETKVRRRANPFGFGIAWSDLSPRQLSIVVALGLSRG